MPFKARGPVIMPHRVEASRYCDNPCEGVSVCLSVCLQTNALMDVNYKLVHMVNEVTL